MKMTKNGCSTCPKGEEQFEVYYSAFDKEPRIEYDYRTPDGVLFSCVARSLTDAQVARDVWRRKREANLTR